MENKDAKLRVGDMTKYFQPYDMDNSNRDEHTILIVDDAPENLSLLRGLLKNHYKIKIAINGAKALQIAANNKLSLILLDIVMPDMDGYEVCRQLKRSETTSRIPVIFLTGMTATVDEEKGLALGAADYLHKPISPPILMARVQTQLKLKEANDFLLVRNEVLEKMVKQRTRQLEQSHDATIVAMGTLAEFRDPETGHHLRRTQHYIKQLANELRKNPKYTDYLTPERIDILFKSAPLHDIGKVGVPDNILLKPGPLTGAEFEEMKKHPVYGETCIVEAEKQMGDEDSFLLMARQIILHHHEKWDGSGYPYKLVGEDIPLSARLMVFADVYDALISVRVYKPAFSHEKAISIIKKDVGTHFDPLIADSFFKISDEFNLIAQQFSDT